MIAAREAVWARRENGGGIGQAGVAGLGWAVSF
jgi:hypothetical protein